MRWKVLVAVGAFVVLFDQWTKFLAVKHLTTGILVASVGADTAASLSDLEREHALSQVGFFAGLRSFYTEVASPCAGAGLRCPPVKVIDGFWDWRYAENRGAAWSTFATSDKSFRIPFFISVTLIALVLIVVYVRKLQESERLLLFALSLVFGGALGNLIDRARLGYVVDFIDWYVGSSHWPTFNVADSAITTAVTLILINQLFQSRGKAKANRPVPGNG